MRCLVTGGTGLIGSHFVRHLVEEGHDVLITGHKAEQALPFFQESEFSQVSVALIGTRLET